MSARVPSPSNPALALLSDASARSTAQTSMESDSYKRYLASPAFQLLSRQFEQRQKKLQVLMEMEVI